MTTLSVSPYFAPVLPMASAAAGTDWMLAGADKLYVATAEQGMLASLDSLPLAPRLGEAPNGYHPFSAEKMDRARRWFRSQAGDLKISPARAEALGEKVLSHLRCIDPITFKQALIQMGIAVRHFVGDEPYQLIINKPYRSHWFVYQALRAMGLIPEAAAVSDLSGQIKSGDLFDQLDEIADENLKIVLLDDCAYKGDALRVDHLFEHSINRARIFVGLVAATERAWNRFFLPLVFHYVGLKIDFLDEVFDETEKKILKRPIPASPIYGPLPSSAPSTFTWYKLPDNLAAPLELCGLKTISLETDENGNQVFPNASPLYYEILHPDLLIRFPPEERHRLRREVQDILAKEGPEGVTEFLQFVSAKLK